MNMMTRQMPTAPYQKLARLLEKANFVTADWNVQQTKTPPEVEDANRRIYIVFPPEPPPRPNPMQPPTEAGMSPQDRQIVLDAIKQSGMAIFLAGWTPPQSPMPGAQEVYEYGEYLEKNWGVRVENNFVALEFTPDLNKPGWWAPASREPRLLTTDKVVRFTNHPIGKPLQADRAGFLMVAPLEILTGEDLSEGVTVEPIAEVAESDDVWACGDLRRLDEQWKRDRGFKRDPADIAAPFDIAVAATNKDGQKSRRVRQRGVRVRWMAQASGLRQAGDTLVLGLVYPANADLLVNTVHWLTGEADRIAVGPRSGELPVLNKLDAKWAARVPWFLVLIWPAVGLLAGVGVWLVRRR